MTAAPTVVSTATTLISRHAELAGLAAKPGMVSETLRSGGRLVSASSAGGYGNAGAWGLVRRIPVEELQVSLEELERDGNLPDELWADWGRTVNGAALLVLDGGRTPLWHVVIENMLRRKQVLSTYFVVQDVAGMLRDHLQEHVFDFAFGEDDAVGLTGDELEQELLNAGELLKAFYDQQKRDSKWKGQVAFHPTAEIGHRTFLNALCDRGRFDLLPAALKFTHEGQHGGASPHFVLADVGFGDRVCNPLTGTPLPDATLRADNFGNSPLHVCVYKGNGRTLAAILAHIEALAGPQPERFSVLARFVQSGRTGDRRGVRGETVLETAARAGNWACWAQVAAFLQRHGLGTPDRPRNFVARGIDNVQETQEGVDDGMCEFFVPSVGTFTMESLADMEGTFRAVRGATPNGTATLTFQVKKLNVRRLRGDALQQMVDRLLRFALQFKVVRFSRSRVDAVAMQEILRALAHMIHDEEVVCEELGLGMQPCEGDTETLHPMHVWRLMSALAQLLPAKRCMVINVHRMWGDRFSTPGCAFLLHLFGSLGDVLDLARGDAVVRRTRGTKGRGKAEQSNPLEANPFMPGLCRVKQVAFHGWRRLCGAQTLADAIHPETLPFLRALGAVWRLCEAALPQQGVEHEKTRRHLQQAREFLHQMTDFVGGRSLDAFAKERWGEDRLRLADGLNRDFDRFFQLLRQ